tara:strand:+ start:104 stop:298 length:195 start_codon:yes stop_codon:yes gene_type:complete
MSKISELDLGSAVLSVCILAGFIATAFVFIRLTVIMINYIKVNYSREEGEDKDRIVNKSESKGF